LFCVGGLGGGRRALPATSGHEQLLHSRIGKSFAPAKSIASLEFPIYKALRTLALLQVFVSCGVLSFWSVKSPASKFFCVLFVCSVQVVRYVQLAAGDVDTEMLQDAARQQSKEGAKA
jgi:hypothetical protein